MNELLRELLLISAAMLADYDLPLPDGVLWHTDPALEGYEMGDAYGRTACTTQPSGQRICYIILHSCVAQVGPAFAKKVMIHELAHYVDYMQDGKMDGHKGYWSRVMLRWNQVLSSKARRMRSCIKAMSKAQP